MDIGTINYTCCAANFSESTDLKAQTTPMPVRNRMFRSVELIDVFNLNVGAEAKGLRALDVLVEAWDELALFQVWQPDLVLIEQQFRKAVVNHAMSIATYTLAKKSFPQCSVRFVRPIYKFSGYKRLFALPSVDYPLKTYKQRKDTAVLLSTAILQEYFGVQSLADVLRSEAFDSEIKKLDDCADAFLQLFCL